MEVTNSSDRELMSGAYFALLCTMSFGCSLRLDSETPYGI